jgi:hypothetical protein
MNGEKKARLIRNRFKFLAESNDMSIDRTSRWEVFVSPNLVEQTIAT